MANLDREEREGNEVVELQSIADADRDHISESQILLLAPPRRRQFFQPTHAQALPSIAYDRSRIIWVDSRLSYRLTFQAANVAFRVVISVPRRTGIGRKQPISGLPLERR